MNQGFKLRFDQMRESDPTASDAPLDAFEADVYPPPGYGRNLGLIWPDGRRMFFNYAYLLAGEFEPGGEHNQIRLNFSSHTVTLQGFRLDKLFMALLDHTPRLIRAIDIRYVLDEDKLEAIVTNITVETKAE